MRSSNRSSSPRQAGSTPARERRLPSRPCSGSHTLSDQRMMKCGARSVCFHQVQTCRGQSFSGNTGVTWTPASRRSSALASDRQQGEAELTTCRPGTRCCVAARPIQVRSDVWSSIVSSAFAAWTLAISLPSGRSRAARRAPMLPALATSRRPATLAASTSRTLLHLVPQHPRILIPT